MRSWLSSPHAWLALGPFWWRRVVEIPLFDHSNAHFVVRFDGLMDLQIPAFPPNRSIQVLWRVPLSVYQSKHVSFDVSWRKLNCYLKVTFVLKNAHIYVCTMTPPTAQNCRFNSSFLGYHPDDVPVSTVDPSVWDASNHLWYHCTISPAPFSLSLMPDNPTCQLGIR